MSEVAAAMEMIAKAVLAAGGMIFIGLVVHSFVGNKGK